MEGKKVLITAGASGLGLEMAKVFTAAGCQVLVCDLNQTLLDAAKKECPSLHATVADVSDEDSVAALFEQVRKVLGGLDVLINNAGIAGPTGYEVGRASGRERVCRYVEMWVVAGAYKKTNR